MSGVGFHAAVPARDDRGIPPGGVLPADFLRQTWIFLGRLTVAMVVLWLVWIPVGPSYRKLVVAVGNAGFSLAGPTYAVEFRKFRDWRSLGLEFDSRADIAVLVRRPQWVDEQGRAQHLLAKRIVAFSQPYAATVFLVALFVATRLPWRARVARGLGALVGLHALMVLCVAIDVVHTFAAESTRPDLPRWSLEILSVLKVSVTDWPAGIFLVPLVLWLVACWPRRGSAPAQSGLSRSGVSG